MPTIRSNYSRYVEVHLETECVTLNPGDSHSFTGPVTPHLQELIASNMVTLVQDEPEAEPVPITKPGVHAEEESV